MSTSPTIQVHQVAGREVLACLPAAASTKTPLLFVHGAFAGAWMWADNFMPWFAQAGYPCYAVSLRGHGNSSEAERLDWLGISDYVDDLKAVADWLEVEPALVGHSMGGFVVQKYLERYRAPAAVLLCSVPPQGLVASQFHLLMQKPGLFLELNKVLSGEEVGLETVREALFAQPASDAVLTSFRNHMQRESHRAIWDMSVFNFPLLMVQERPPLFIAGAELDVLVPAFLVQATAQTYSLPDHIFKGMGHAVTHEQDWPHVADTLKTWLDSQLA